MKSSAKTTAVSFLAAAALGAVVFMGCTVSSGTVNDTDGGTQVNNPKTDGGTGTDNDSGTAQGDGGAVGAVCKSGQKDYFVNETCQACLENNCCTQLQGCFDLPADSDAGLVDCNDYTSCIDDVRDDCNAKATQQEQDECFAVCDTTAAAGVQKAYEDIVTCATSSCATECGG